MGARRSPTRGSAMPEVLIGNAERQIYAVWNTTVPQGTEPKGGILILADTGVAFQGLLKAAQQCFPKLDVALSNQLPEDGPGALIPRIVLIHPYAFRNTSAIVAQCRERFPGTPIALMVDQGWFDLPGLRTLVSERQVQGLLPFNMQINVWLATVWLLLNGGEYFPVGEFHGHSHHRANGTNHDSRDVARPQGGTGDILSTRENQVLELMSEGLQNKLIAVKMELSEHTVKVHVHNIIRKLKVHNRTQAAAVFRSNDPRIGSHRNGAPWWLEPVGT